MRKGRGKGRGATIFYNILKSAKVSNAWHIIPFLHRQQRKHFLLKFNYLSLSLSKKKQANGNIFKLVYDSLFLNNRTRQSSLY